MGSEKIWPTYVLRKSIVIFDTALLLYFCIWSLEDNINGRKNMHWLDDHSPTSTEINCLKIIIMKNKIASPIICEKCSKHFFLLARLLNLLGNLSLILIIVFLWACANIVCNAVFSNKCYIIRSRRYRGEVFT